MDSNGQSGVGFLHLEAMTIRFKSGTQGSILVFSLRLDNPILTFREHQAAVRALAWSPHQYGVLLSGGGNGDRSLKVWNINTASLVSSIQTESQVKVKI